MPEATRISRRSLIKALGGVVSAAAVAPHLALAQPPAAGPMAPPSTITTPPRDFGPGGAPTTYFTDPDVLTIDPMFNGLRQPNAAIKRLWTARCGRRDRRGAASDVTSCGATFRTTARCAGWKTTAA